MYDTTEHLRFPSVSERIDFERLDRETYKLFYLGLVLAVCFHTVLFVSIRRELPVVISERYIPAEIYVHPPRMTKPFYVTDKTFHERYRYRRKTAPGIPSRDIVTKSQTLPDAFDESVLKPDITAENLHDSLLDSLFVRESNFRIPLYSIPFQRDIFVDTGNQKSMIIVPPGDKMAIQGYTHIAIGSSFALTPDGNLKSSVRNLVQALMSYTNIHAEYDSLAYVSRPPTKEVLRTAVYDTESRYRKEALDLYERPFNSLVQYPFLYFTTDRGFELEGNEKLKLGNYLAHGGFVILDNGLPEYGARSIPDTLIAMVTDSINSVAVVCSTKNLAYLSLATTKKLPHNHPVYHCFFDFDNGPPPSTCAALKDNEILGIYFYDRLVGVYCPQGYGRSWNDRRNDDQLRMGVNLVVYALTRRQGTIMVDCEKERIVWRDRPSGAVRVW